MSPIPKADLSPGLNGTLHVTLIACLSAALYDCLPVANDVASCLT